MKRCPNCGALNLFNEVECVNCGILMRSPSPAGRSDGDPGLSVRECERVNIANAQAFITLKDGAQKEVSIQNISAKGICVGAEFLLELNDEVGVTMVLPFCKEPIKRRATVSWRTMITEKLWKFGLNFGDNKIDVSSLFPQVGPPQEPV